MRYLKLTLILLSLCLLAACAHREKNYIKQSKTISPLVVPAGIKVKQASNYYPIPYKPSSAKKPPSLIPPGSNLERFSSKSAKHRHGGHRYGRNHHRRITVARWSQTQQGRPMLILAENKTSAWHDVAKAIHSTGYQLLDQDTNIGTFYILDIPSTNNQVTDATPIYALNLVAHGKTTMVRLMNKNNKMTDSKTAKRILGTLQQHLTTT